MFKLHPLASNRAFFAWNVAIFRPIPLGMSSSTVASKYPSSNHKMHRFVIQKRNLNMLSNPAKVNVKL